MSVRGFFSRLRRMFTWKRVLIGIGVTICLIIMLAVGGLWYLSNYLGIPEHQEITAYRYLNPSEENVCVNPETGEPEPSYQGWCDNQRQIYYRMPQGTDFFGIQYDWVANLERPFGKKQLMTRQYMEAIGYVYDPTRQNPSNPYDLPVGLTWHEDEERGGRILDVSCAACHSGHMTYKGTAIVVDGSPGGHALPALEPTQFVAYSIVSMTSTYINPFKFNRFANKVLADVPREEYKAAKKALKKQMRQSIGEALGYARYNLFLYPTTEGYGRTDGLGRIANTVFGDYITPENYRIANAPVNYPHTWDIWAFDWVQWMGSVRQAMARNVNEALGTRARIDLRTAGGLFDHSVMLAEQHCIETTLQNLKPPTWPEDLFGTIDDDLVEKGREIFEATCQTCHGPFPQKAVNGKVDYSQTAKHHSCQTCHGPYVTAPDGDLKSLIAANKHPNISGVGTEKRASTAISDAGQSYLPLHNNEDGYADQSERADYWEMIHIPLDYIGTDPTSALNMINLRYDISSIFELANSPEANPILKTNLPPTCEEAPKDPYCLDDPKETPFATGLRYLGGEARLQQYRDWDLMERSGYTPRPEHERGVSDLDGFGEIDNPVAWYAYRPRPLEGIWATAPYLHNGSVPSIYQLLLPAEERDAVFYLGRKEFDPRTLGFEVSKFKGAFEFDTRVTGNSNLGHEFDDGLCGDGVIGFAIPGKPGYCRQFSEGERMAILEYLKVHSDGERPDPGSKPHCINVKWPGYRQ
ncbi:MAG: di-heme-cytochrome C peroxidase [Pseudomonadota bacterium]